jgi:hypothetical protein
LEYLDGIEMFAAPSDEGHATHHCDLAYVLRAHVVPAYRGAVDMLTRTEEATDFAPDASIFPNDPDTETGGRQLEELAFEITDKQRLSVPTRKARELIRRGVRRVFCLRLPQGRVLEWSRETDGWTPLPEDAVIEDPVLVRPLPVRALVDAAASDDAVARALLDRRVPVIEHAMKLREQQGIEQGIEQGIVRGRRALLLRQLRHRFGPLDAPLVERVEAASGDQLDIWGERILDAEHVDEVFAPLQPPDAS